MKITTIKRWETESDDDECNENEKKLWKINIDRKEIHREGNENGREQSTMRKIVMNLGARTQLNVQYTAIYNRVLCVRVYFNVNPLNSCIFSCTRARLKWKRKWKQSATAVRQRKIWIRCESSTHRRITHNANTHTRSISVFSRGKNRNILTDATGACSTSVDKRASVYDTENYYTCTSKNKKNCLINNK